MRSPQRSKIQTWGWGDILQATGESDAALRRKHQRNQVKLATDSDGRTRATIWDIAILRLSRHLCDLGAEAKRAYGLAAFSINLSYENFITGKRSFGASMGSQQEFQFLVFSREAGHLVGPTIVKVRPSDPQPGLVELGLQASNPANVIVPVHRLVLDAWYSLPDLPDDVAAWMRASSENLARLEKARPK